MGGSGLDGSSVAGDEGFDGGGVETASELFLLRLATLDDGNGEELLVGSSASEREDSTYLA